MAELAAETAFAVPGARQVEPELVARRRAGEARRSCLRGSGAGYVRADSSVGVDGFIGGCVRVLHTTYLPSVASFLTHDGEQGGSASFLNSFGLKLIVEP